MSPELRELLFKLLEILGNMEVEYDDGRKSRFTWDFEAKKPKSVK